MHVLWLHAYENLPKRCISLNVSQSELESLDKPLPKNLSIKKCKGHFRNNINMFPFVRHYDRSKFSEGSTCLPIPVFCPSMSPLYNENRRSMLYMFASCFKLAEKIFGTFILDWHLNDYIRGLTIVLSTVGNRSTISRLVMKMSHSKSPECWAIIWLQVPE